MLRYRILSAIVGIPLVLAFLWYGQWPLLFMMAVLAIVGQLELGNIFRVLEIHISKGISILGSVLLLLALYFQWDVGQIVALLVVLILLRMVVRYPEFTPAGAAGTLFGVFYVGWMLAHLYLIRQLPQEGFHFLLLVFVANWSSDTLAYVTGRSLGKHKLAPLVSPKKTVEGGVGGILGSIIGTVAFYLVSPQAELVHYIILGIGIAIFGQLGDLAESALKRQAGVKDSGNIIPGHGGVLDRFDSILLTAPLAYYYIKVFIL
ncbi:MAG: phosphatidate cytidylyltransferase [Clostridia bacterium]|nr:phosphatidate cytidylyltransferase [Clostridia bacterium]